ncbi:MAG: exodeoxyribonuclease VII large subunit [Calditrichia bacterium]
MQTNLFFEESNGSPDVFTVGQLTREIKVILENAFPLVWVEGEISNFKKHSSGHLYFTLKDETAQISCVMWKNFNARLMFRPEDGMKVLCKAELTVYERNGNYQLKVLEMNPAGIGNLQLAFEQLKKKLSEKGYFDQKYKKTIPEFPKSVGVVTSPTGAAIRDIISVIKRRQPQVRIILRPVKVQGEGAAEEIARAIREFNEYGKVDVLIVGRGGGSLEDLWAFNEEVVAQAIFDSKIPIISAVGHEIDFSIADFVADLRAPTPSAAAELAVKDNRELQVQIRHLQSKLNQIIIRYLQSRKDKLNMYKNAYGFRRPEDFIQQKIQYIDGLSERIKQSISNKIGMSKQSIEGYRHRLSALNPKNVMERGYSITFQHDRVIKDAKHLNKDEPVHVVLFKGAFTGKIDEINKE